ncbi:MAG TPA: prephenate dehydrogenase/arogenate dehydrogenase family protein [Planctomycetota bacterium]|nr:prephenate dehydrogenase/arogenate dehydrogenase family protein [Planctomycetota bacterium]
MAPLFKNALVLGTGLMGTSLALALRERKVAGLIAGYDPSPEARAMAGERDCFAYVEADLEKALATGELVVLAAPPRSVRELLPHVAAKGQAGRLVIDIASTKRLIVQAAEDYFIDTASAFVGGHPMAGAPSGGARAARADLFEGAPFALCPTRVSPPEALERAKELVRALGAKAVVIDASLHDAAVARISHLPHLAAVATALAAGEAPDEKLAARLASSGFRSTTRVAAGGRPLWTEVLLDNRVEALACLDSLRAAIASIEDALRREDEEALGGILEFAREIRTKLLDGRIGTSSSTVSSAPDEDSGERP